MKFLDKSHGEDWCIWEFRAEGTGYPDKEVRGKVRHYPWPDHHPPPFAVVPLVMAGMRNWLTEGELPQDDKNTTKDSTSKGSLTKKDTKSPNGRVVVVHCKAGKGRSGTIACSYLISQCGWTKDEALARFTERRMRPGFGQGVSIPSQLRWVGYTDRWTKCGKKYVDRQIEILEVHVWGLRDGVKVAVEGYIDEGKVIHTFHVFGKNERLVVEEGTPGGAGFTDMISDMAGYGSTSQSIDRSNTSLDGSNESKIQKATQRKTLPILQTPSKTNIADTSDIDSEAGGGAVMFKPAKPLIVPSSDINIDFERRNKAGYGMTMVTSVAHVWFNTFFEGNGPEQDGKADETGVFEIDWDKMDGIKGSLRKGTRALDRLSVVWRAYNPEPGTTRGSTEVKEPGKDSPVPEMAAADPFRGSIDASGKGKDLGLRTESPHSADVSKASSIKSSHGDEKESADADDDSVKGLKTSGPDGGEDINVDITDLPQPEAGQSVPSLEEVNEGLDTASKTTPLQR